MSFLRRLGSVVSSILVDPKIGPHMQWLMMDYCKTRTTFGWRKPQIRSLWLPLRSIV
ncbi:hypothetical protein Gogos_010353 [Gossypium gossypioides]|uniref:Uncharacterized protein n=1 Tax=Gossypium gossypioides TaxID=34282 RepID=A0A7J9BL16_GOSGO|nr:hypothetical protein [Gossypium gossypioides]